MYIIDLMWREFPTAFPPPSWDPAPSPSGPRKGGRGH